LSLICQLASEDIKHQLIITTTDVLQDQKIHCLQLRPCSFQPGNFTGRGSEGVKTEALSDPSPNVEMPERNFVFFFLSISLMQTFQLMQQDKVVKTKHKTKERKKQQQQQQPVCCILKTVDCFSPDLRLTLTKRLFWPNIEETHRGNRRCLSTIALSAIG